MIQVSRLSLPLGFALVLAVSSCSSSPSGACANLPDGGFYCLQSAATVPAFVLQQKADFNFGGQRQTLILSIESGADGIRLAGLTPFGHKVLELNYDNRIASVSAQQDRRLSPELLIALLQITLWPADVVRNGLDPTPGLEDNKDIRQLLREGKPVMTIEHGRKNYNDYRIRMIISTIPLELTLEQLPDIAEEL